MLVSPPSLGRLERAADFERLLKTQSRARSTLFALHHLGARPTPAPKPAKLSTAGAQLAHSLVDTAPEPSPETPVDRHWLGFVVPKRLARRAVTRNLVRRLARASFQAELQAGRALPPGLWALRLRAPIDRQRFVSADSALLRATLHQELAQLWKRALR